MINYLEDYQLQEIKEAVGKSFYVNGCPTGRAKILRVGKSNTTFVTVKNPSNQMFANYKIGVVFQEPNRIAYNIIG